MTELENRLTFDGSDAAGEPRKRRAGITARVGAGVALLALVGGVAVVTSGGTTKPRASTGPGGSSVGTMRPGPVPPELVFANDKLGYAFYKYCNAQPEGEGCRATLLRTEDAGSSWLPVTLPEGIPVDPASWSDLQAHNDDLVLSWKGGAQVSQDQGKTWKTVSLDAVSQTSLIAPSQFLVDAGQGAMALDPVHATAVRFRADTDLDQPATVGGALPDGGVWAANGSLLDVSTNGGFRWHHATLGSTAVVRAPLLGPAGHYARLSGTLSSQRSGPRGDGGELPASDFLFSTNAGDTWTPATITGPQVNALCTVFLKNGDLLGVSVDGTSLLRLAKGKTAFTKVSPPPPAVPSCLSSGAGLVWGATFDGKFVISPDTASGPVWTSGSLAKDTHYGVAMPSPAPSSAK